MEDEELRHWIEDKIVAGVSHDEIVMQTAERASVNWQEAELIVEDVFQQKQGRINRRQGPLMLAISLLVVAGGAIGCYDLVRRMLYYAEAADAPGGSWLNLIMLAAEAPYLMMGLAFMLAVVAGGVGGVVKILIGMMES